MLNLKKYGDILEQKYYDEIVTTIPQYEEFWKIFIGNNGKAKIIESENDEVDKIRKNIAQHSYTIFESLVCLFKISTKNSSITDVNDYLDANNDFILFHAHCGRIRDCVNKIGVILKKDDLGKGLENFYKLRNQVLHGKKLPFTIIEDLFVLPKVIGTEFNPKLWNDELLWEDVSTDELEVVNQIYSDLYKEMISCLNSVYSKMLSKINEDNELKNVITMMKNYLPKNEDYVTVSGIVNNHFMADRIISSSNSFFSGSIVK